MFETWTFYVVSSALCGFVAAFIAKLKGRPPMPWFVIGLVLNIAVLAVIFAVERRRKQRCLSRAESD